MYEADTENGSSRIVLKISRDESFLMIPMAWLGRILCGHELSIHERLGDIDGIPRILSGYGRTGLVHEYIEGQSLDEKPKLPEGFFEDLRRVVGQIHSRKIRTST